MAQSNGNVPISSLLDSNSNQEDNNNSMSGSVPLSQPQGKQPTTNSHPSKNTSLSSLVSRYQTTFNFSSTPTPEPEDDELIILDKLPTLAKKSKPQSKNASNKSSPKPQTAATTSSSRQSSSLPVLMPKPSSDQQSKNFNYSDQIKKFQTNIQFGPAASTSTGGAFHSKTSINSIINLDDESDSPKPQTPTPTPAAATATTTTSGPPRKKRPPPKKVASPKADSVSKPKKKSPESTTSSALANVTSAAPAPVKKPLHAGMITERSSVSAGAAPVKLGAPSFVDLLNSDHESDKVEEIQNEVKEEDKTKSEDKTKQEDKSKEKEKEKPEPPIIALNIPLLDPKDPKPGKAEVVINVLRLAEEKYGWSVVHPKAKSAIDIMDDMMDEDDEGMDDDDEEDVIVDEEKSAQPPPPPPPAAAAAKDKELTEQQLVRQHEIRMIRKVGKYDYEDPFIDDEELQMEEEITTTKEGFFVYWGPLVDDRNISNKKGSSKKR
ncbi:uncharacterized protein SPAPADRAFT_51116 [Spathaspora passalidarum NRRL Y-27907]|uniref:Hpc2-related domain-containing protein n=1 Tax=Spathaspora passalidarum (strain NRRL Y-27907 / 11-Y1) TaxID=619300 RepID=G3ANU8_SPAPN|nr:uncharacterized protein SPAPADRAFT_51116 [Spathaspora passalidarum NRRL Y-27907]EGW32573.1 hypothetical protein SPAPADRAFT_51116 [Spathaspora passalidarum NRRL Y-27907]